MLLSRVVGGLGRGVTLGGRTGRGEGDLAGVLERVDIIGVSVDSYELEMTS